MALSYASNRLSKDGTFFSNSMRETWKQNQHKEGKRKVEKGMNRRYKDIQENALDDTYSSL